VFFLTVTALNFYYYPIYFEQDVLRNTFGYLSAADMLTVKANYFDQIYKPFFSYYFYALPLWCLVILPTFLIFLNGFGEDYRILKTSIDALSTERKVAFVEGARSDTEEMLALKEELSHLKRLSKTCIHNLRMLVQRYLPVLLVVLIGFGLGNLLLTGAIKAGTSVLAPIQTKEAISSFAWIIVIFVAICALLFIYLVRLFSEYRQALSLRVDRLLDEVTRRNLNHTFWDTINDDSKVWDTREIDILPFLLSTLINRGVIHLPILLFATMALFAFVVNGYLQAITPLSVQEFFQKYFVRPQPPSSGAP
jgi:uncharacterized membrane-anchored protein YitT (DUF2179 family)